jgi:hypothetical protein
MKRTAGEYAVLLALLDEALELDVAARNAWLDALPESHAHLRPTLQRMLGAARYSIRLAGATSIAN